MLLAMISAVDSQGHVVDFAAEARAMSARGGIADVTCSVRALSSGKLSISAALLPSALCNGIPLFRLHFMRGRKALAVGLGALPPLAGDE